MLYRCCCFAGTCFVQLKDDMKKVYAVYCRNHDDVISLLEKVCAQSTYRSLRCGSNANNSKSWVCKNNQFLCHVYLYNASMLMCVVWDPPRGSGLLDTGRRHDETKKVCLWLGLGAHQTCPAHSQVPAPPLRTHEGDACLTTRHKICTTFGLVLLHNITLLCSCDAQSTEDSHPDKVHLHQALDGMTDVAAAINEFKRRKDLGKLL